MEIRIDKTKHSCGKGSQYHAVLTEIVQRKAEQQLKKWEKVKPSPVQFSEPVDSDEEYLPF